jgi:hypothetical protein
VPCAWFVALLEVKGVTPKMIATALAIRFIYDVTARTGEEPLLSTRILRKWGILSPKTARRSLDQLQQSGLIEVTKQGRGRGKCPIVKPVLPRK